jgi:SAM-dependent methyltransferase
VNATDGVAGGGPSTGREKRWRPNLRRSINLALAFRHEQRDPRLFYDALAKDAVDQLAGYVQLDGAVVLDVGGGPGDGAAGYRRRGAQHLLLDKDFEVLKGAPTSRRAAADGTLLPIRSGAVDVCFSSNVLEHVPEPEAFAGEMLRVTRPGGIVFLSYTNWLSPNGGHETGPIHLLIGGRRAAERYARRTGRRPLNDFGSNLFAYSAARMIAWAHKQAAAGEAEVVAKLPRYHPWWARWVIAVPGLREVASWNVLLVLRRSGSAPA